MAGSGDLLSSLVNNKGEAVDADDDTGSEEFEASYPDFGSDDLLESAFMSEEEYLAGLGQGSIAKSKQAKEKEEEEEVFFFGEEEADDEEVEARDEESGSDEGEVRQEKPQEVAPTPPPVVEEDNRYYPSPTEYRNHARAYYIKEVLKTNNVEFDDKNFSAQFNKFMTGVGANDQLAVMDWIRERTDSEVQRYKENDWAKHQESQTKREHYMVSEKLKGIFPDIAEYVDAMKSHESTLQEKWPGILEIPAMAVPLLYAMAKVEGVKKTARAVRSDTRGKAGVNIPALEKGSASARGGKTSTTGRMVDRAFATRGAEIRKPLNF